MRFVSKSVFILQMRIRGYCGGFLNPKKGFKGIIPEGIWEVVFLPWGVHCTGYWCVALPSERLVAETDYRKVVETELTIGEMGCITMFYMPQWLMD